MIILITISVILLIISSILFFRGFSLIERIEELEDLVNVYELKDEETKEALEFLMAWWLGSVIRYFWDSLVSSQIITTSKTSSSGESFSSKCGRARNSLYDGMTIAQVIDPFELVVDGGGFIYNDLQR